MNRKTVPIIIGIAAVGMIVALTPSVISNQTNMASRRDRVGQLSMDLEQSKMEMELSTARKQLAEQRYKEGAVFVVNRENTFISLNEDTPIIDRLTGNPLPKGTWVADIYGNTAELDSEGIPVNFAFTGNSDLVREALERANKNRQFAGIENQMQPGGRDL
ncbi:MAG: hypothetical protein EA367_02335 [Leptolyngbya sp. DLM2.Bin15]|nr:MAG: hypothetical protein EA367_02335 [Leptolyngbya sp. DLM2.Bin15]